MESTETTLVRITAERAGHVRELADFLGALDRCYSALDVFDKWLAPYQGSARPAVVTAPPPSLRRARVGDRAGLEIHAIRISSPGFLEVLGGVFSLETIRKYLADRHERRKDREWREKYEEDQRRLESARVRLELVKEHIALLRSLGYTKTEIRRLVSRFVDRPLRSLDRFQDVELIGSAAASSKETKVLTLGLDGERKFDLGGGNEGTLE